MVNRPGATTCNSCRQVEPYKEMVKVRRKWFCNSCKERMKRYNLWPPPSDDNIPTIETIMNSSSDKDWESIT